MAKLSKILFPLAVIAYVAVSAMDYSRPVFSDYPSISYATDTVIYPPFNYRPKSLLADIVIDSSAIIEDETIKIDTIISPRDSLKALLDSSLLDLFEEIWLSDSLTQIAAADAIWYGSLTKEERKKYDREIIEKQKMAVADSIRKIREKEKEKRDSIIADRPRILDTYALTDSMQYKRIITWTTDDDFGDLKVSQVDTSFNTNFFDYKFQRNDVNSTWLGMAGSPVQYYNFAKRKSDEGVDFYDALEPWSYSARTLPHYNSKTPYTELAYFGTLLATRSKASDNIHLFTTQNVTPELNFSILIENFGGEGMLENEKTTNSNTVFQTNYLGKRYTLHAGYIGNVVDRKENGGIADNKWVRDTTVDSRDIPVILKNASSKTKKTTFFLQQQLRIPFTFIEELKAKKDSTYIPDSLNENITTAFIGHSSEYSRYTRAYKDNLSEKIAKDFYNNVFNYNPSSSKDSLAVTKLDNKVYLRLQPWSSEALISKIDIGVGDVLRNYFDSTATNFRHSDNSVYLYAGAQGQLKGNFFWDAKANYTILGSDFSDLGIEANGKVNIYPFRRNRKSPLSLDVHFETSLKEPSWYNKKIHTNHFKWENSLKKTSRTYINGHISIPHWKLEADLGYTLLVNNLYYDSKSVLRQNNTAMSVLNASIYKDFVFGPLHLDNKVLFQLSSNQEVVPVPKLAANIRYYLEFVAARSPKDNIKPVLTMQIGINAYYNTAWNSPAWNPNLGVFFNQNERLYNNGPYFDIFLNMQWKRACIFVKYQNAGGGWPMPKKDYFSADRFTVTRNGLDGLKLGIFWPFSLEPTGSK